MSEIPIKWSNYIKNNQNQKFAPITVEKAVYGENNKPLNERLADVEGSISDAFSETTSYAIGDYCIYLNSLYKFTSAKDAGPWDGTKVVPCTIGQELGSLNNAMEDYVITRYAYQNNLFINAKYYHEFNLIPESVPGYKPLFAFIARLDSAYAIPMCPADMFDSQQGFILSVANTSGSNITVYIRIVVVYIRQ